MLNRVTYVTLIFRQMTGLRPDRNSRGRLLTELGRGEE